MLEKVNLLTKNPNLRMIFLEIVCVCVGGVCVCVGGRLE